MSVVVIGPAEEKKIKDLIARATANVVPWALTKDVAIGPGVKELTLTDRKNADRPMSEHIVLGNIHVAYSHEEQPAGVFRHISASVEEPGRTPHPMAMAMICEAFGFSEPMCASLMGDRVAPGSIAGLLWLEEFAPGHQAVNIIELIEAHNVH